MKQGHFILLFVILYCYCFLSLLVERVQYDNVWEEKETIENSLKKATEQAAYALIGTMNEPIEVKTQAIEESFFESFYTYAGMLGTTEEVDGLRLYVPMMVLIEENGVVFYQVEEKEENEVSRLDYCWSEVQKFDFELSDKETRYMLADYLEDKAAEIITEHNQIAEQFGLQYRFHTPKFLQDTSKELHFPMLLVVFQGWPLDNMENIIYENCIDAGVYIQEVKRYVVQIPSTLTDTVSYYHSEFCDKVLNREGKFLKEKLSRQEALKQYGAIPCKSCMKFE